MEEPPIISERNFIIYTTLADMNSTEARKIVASHTSRFGRKRNRKKLINPCTNQIVQSFFRWRIGAPPAKKRPTLYDQSKAGSKHATSEAKQVLDSIPACLYPSPSLQQCKPLMLKAS